MNILFVSSGNSKSGVSPIIKNQGESLLLLGHHVSYFTIQGKGIKGYLKNVLVLRNFLKANSFDIVHAHYSMSAFVASLAGTKPVVSLMGSDVKAKSYFKYIIKFFAFFSWKAIIVKSQDMKNSSGLSKVHVIPNGVNLDIFKTIEVEKALQITGWNSNKKHVLFAANPVRKEKNFKLAKEAFDLLLDKNIELHSLIDISNELIPYYLNSAHVVLLTSLWEGSPNVIKEAMACSRPIVCTHVGDVEWLLGSTTGCFVTSFKPEDVAEKIKKAIEFDAKTNGRESIIELGLDSETVSKKIAKLYSQNKR